MRWDMQQRCTNPLWTHSLVQFSARSKVQQNRSEVKNPGFRSDTFYFYVSMFVLNIYLFFLMLHFLFLMLVWKRRKWNGDVPNSLSLQLHLNTSQWILDYSTVNIIIHGNMRLTTWREQQHWCLSPGLHCRRVWAVFSAELFLGYDSCRVLFFCCSPTYWDKQESYSK